MVNTICTIPKEEKKNYDLLQKQYSFFLIQVNRNQFILTRFVERINLINPTIVRNLSKNTKRTKEGFVSAEMRPTSINSLIWHHNTGSSWVGACYSPQPTKESSYLSISSVVKSKLWGKSAAAMTPAFITTSVLHAVCSLILLGVCYITQLFHFEFCRDSSHDFWDDITEHLSCFYLQP